jgi:hypothetical protein
MSTWAQPGGSTGRLRGLLVATALVALALGLVVQTRRVAERESRLEAARRREGRLEAELRAERSRAGAQLRSARRAVDALFARVARSRRDGSAEATPREGTGPP